MRHWAAMHRRACTANTAHLPRYFSRYSSTSGYAQPVDCARFFCFACPHYSTYLVVSSSMAGRQPSGTTITTAKVKHVIYGADHEHDGKDWATCKP